MALENLSKQSTEGCLAPGLHQEVIQGIGTTERQLLPSESHSLILLDASDQITVRLPTPVLGMMFEFLTTVSVTSSDTHKVITKTIASEFMIGGIGAFATDIAVGGDSFSANGTTHVALESNGSTTGGILGQHIVFRAISTTQWAVSGAMVGTTGTQLTPFATS